MRHVRPIRCLCTIVAALLAGCTAPHAAPPRLAEGVPFTATSPTCLGSYATPRYAVTVDTFTGPEYYATHYAYSAMLVEGTVTLKPGALLSLDAGTIYIDAKRFWSKITASEAELIAAANPSPVGGVWAPDPAQPKSVSSLWWFPIIVTGSTGAGSVGTDFIVRRTPDPTGAPGGTTEVFLRTPTTAPFKPQSRVWTVSLSGPSPVTWLSHVDKFLRPETPAPTTLAPYPGTPVPAAPLPLPDDLAAELTAIDAMAAKCGLR